MRVLLPVMVPYSLSQIRFWQYVVYSSMGPMCSVVLAKGPSVRQPSAPVPLPPKPVSASHMSEPKKLPESASFCSSHHGMVPL